MKIIWLCVNFIFLGLGEIRANNVQDLDEFSNIDLLMNGLKREKWTQDEKLCLDTMVLTLESAKNSTLWAVWMLDAMQIPYGQLYGISVHIGNFDQCMDSDTILINYRPEFLTQYCLADVVLTDKRVASGIPRPEYNISVHTYFESLTGFKRNLTSMLWGICVPRVCHQKTIPKILKVYLKNSHLASFSDTAKISINNCQPASREYPTGYYVFLSFVVLLAVTTISCTLYTHSNNNKNATVNNSFIAELARCFCLKRNMESVTEVRNKEVKSLNVIRFLASFLTSGGHIMLFLIWSAVNKLQVEVNMFGISSQSNVNVDTFFLLSGLLFTRAFWNDKSWNPFISIWKRLIRLAAGFVTVVLFATYVFYNTGGGPIWSKFADKEQEVCEKNLWFNLLMLGNYNVNKLCLTPLWYVPCDYQLCLLATFIFYIYNKNKNYGIFTFVILFLVGLLLPGILTYWNNWHPLVFPGVEFLINKNDNMTVKYNYVTTHSHLGSFMVGMALACIFHTYNPSNYRNVISTKWSYAGIVTALCTMLSVMFIAQLYIDVQGTAEAAIFISLHRIVWAIAVALLIGISEYGTLPILNDVFAWHPFAVLSRLTYGVYLVHLLFLQHLQFSLRDNYTFTNLDFGVTNTGILVFCLIISLLLWLLVEAPVINVNNLLLERMFPKDKTPKKEATSPNDTTTKKVVTNLNDVDH